jgi:TPR repeat protein
VSSLLKKHALLVDDKLMSPISHAAAWDAMLCELFQDKPEVLVPQIRNAYIQIIRQCAERGYVNVSHESIRFCVLFSTHVASKKMAHLMRRQAPSKNQIYFKIQKLHFSEKIRCRLFGCGGFVGKFIEKIYLGCRERKGTPHQRLFNALSTIIKRVETTTLVEKGADEAYVRGMELTKRGECAEAVKYLQIAVSKRHIGAVSALAFMLIAGRRGVSLEVQAFRSLIKFGINFDSIDCKALDIYLRLQHPITLEEKLQQLLSIQTYVKAGSSYAKLVLGRMLANGIPTHLEQDWHRAYDLFIESGLSPAFHLASHIVDMGKIEADENVASRLSFSLILRAANEGYPHAILETAKNYFEGKGVERSLEKGFYWCSLIQETNEKAASLSSYWAMVRKLAQFKPEYIFRFK